MSVVHKWIRTRAMREKWLYLRMRAQLVQSVKAGLAVQEEADAAQPNRKAVTKELSKVNS